jgi:hypothetical protein
MGIIFSMMTKIDIHVEPRNDIRYKSKILGGKYAVRAWETETLTTVVRVRIRILPSVYIDKLSILISC